MDVKKLQGLAELKAYLQSTQGRTVSSMSKHAPGHERRVPFEADLAACERHLAFVQQLIDELAAS
jgi:hypothetical protein